ncbi:MAG: outer membrane protein transport protein [Gammaproteobacteria bacterium]|nr:outer membrane protein transport protein [Gammaproteobacteria bacterium]
MKNITKILPLLTIGLSSSVNATNGYQLIGIGSYQNSLGGAVTAKPGSAMTAITNPAGMSRIGKRADYSMEMFMPDRFVDFTRMGGESSDSAAKQYGVPAIGWTAPVVDADSDLYFGGGIYGTSGLGADYPQTQYSAAGGGYPAMYFEGYSAIQFWQMAPTLAWNVDNSLSLGASLNIDYQSVAMKQSFTADTVGDTIPDTPMVNFDLSRAAQAFGFGITLGVLYDVNEQVTVGASYKSKQSFGDLEYQLSRGDIMDNMGTMTMTGCAANICPAGTYVLNLDFPAMLSMGIAYSPVKALTLSMDIKQIKWSDTLSSMNLTGPNGIRISLPAGWDDQTIIALGVEYAVNQRLNIRMGYNQADAPIDDSDTDANYILPATVESHIAFGADYRLSPYWDLGFHVSRASEKVLNSPSTGAKIGLEISTFGINLGYRFD